MGLRLMRAATDAKHVADDDRAPWHRRLVDGRDRLHRLFLVVCEDDRCARLGEGFCCRESHPCCGTRDECDLTVEVQYIAHGVSPLPIPSISLFLAPNLLRTQQRLDCTAFVHSAVAFCYLIQRQAQIEDLAGVDLFVQHELDQFRQVAADSGGSSVQMHV